VEEADEFEQLEATAKDGYTLPHEGAATVELVVQAAALSLLFRV
jgi:hypothetical protein